MSELGERKRRLWHLVLKAENDVRLIQMELDELKKHIGLI